MKIKKLKSLDIFILLMSLEGLLFRTSLGALSFSLIGSFIFLLRITLTSKRIIKNSIYSNSLLLLGLFFTFTSFFIGDSIIGNLVRIWISVFIAYSLPYLEINPQQWANSIRKIILFHAIFLIFDFFFETPWGWDSEGYFFLGFNVPDLYRPQGLFGEPSYYGFTINCLFLILVILRKCSVYDCLLVLSTNLLSTSLSGILCSVAIAITNYSFEIKRILNKILKGKFNKNIVLIIALLMLFLLALQLIEGGWMVRRLTAPLEDSSILGRTIGTYPIVKYVFQNSPLFGLGLGSTIVNNIAIGNFQFSIGDKTIDIAITTANALVGILYMGGFVGLILYLIYNFSGLQLKYLPAYFFLLASSGKSFFIFLFIIPAFNKYILNKKLSMKNKVIQNLG